MKEFSLRASKDCSNIAIDFKNSKGKWVTQKIFKKVGNEEIPAWQVLKEINMMMYLDYKPKSIAEIIIQTDDKVLKFL